MKTATPLHKIHILMYFTMNHEKSQERTIKTMETKKKTVQELEKEVQTLKNTISVMKRTSVSESDCYDIYRRLRCLKDIISELQDDFFERFDADTEEGKESIAYEFERMKELQTVVWYGVSDVVKIFENLGIDG